MNQDTALKNLRDRIAVLSVVVLLAGVATAQTITSPAAGAVLKQGKPCSITWSGATIGTAFLIEDSYDGGVTYGGSIYTVLNPQSANGGWNGWHPSKASDNVFIALVDPTSQSVIDSKGPMTVYSNQGLNIVVQSPATNGIVKQDSIYTIRWDVPNRTPLSPDSLRVFASLAYDTDTNSNVSKMISPRLAGDAITAQWRVPKCPTGHVKIVVSTFDNVQGATANFAIQGAIANITFPTSGSTLTIGDQDTIQWNFSAPVDGPIRVEWSPTGGSPKSWITIDSALPKTATWRAWSPTQVAANAYVRITADSGFLVKTIGPFTTQQKQVGVAENTSPSSWQVEQNFPNPFSASLDNGLTTIPFSLSTGTTTGLQVFDVLGRLVSQTPRQFYDAGRHTISFKAIGLQPGLYGYQIAGSTLTRRMLFVR